METENVNGTLRLLTNSMSNRILPLSHNEALLQGPINDDVDQA